MINPLGLVLGIVVGTILVILLLPFLDRYVGPIFIRYLDWVDRRFR